MATKPWHKAEREAVHKYVFPYVSEVERVQSDIFDRMVKLAALYDPAESNVLDGRGIQSLVSENVVASNCDTVCAVIAATEIRARFMTDDGDWSTQRTARHLEWYAEGLSKLLEVRAACRAGFKQGAMKGTGLNKVYIDAFGTVTVEPTLVDDIIVDQGESRIGRPRQLHQRQVVGIDVAKAQFADVDGANEALNSARRGSYLNERRQWADYRPVQRDEVVIIESWYLPIGDNPGRHTICIEGMDLLDEDWDKPYFPFAVFRWSERPSGWYGIGLAERIAGHQRALNKLNWQIDRQLDQHAVPTTFVRLADANLTVKTTNRAGTIVPIKGEMPVTVIPPAVSGETYRRQEVIKASSFEESGVSRMAAQSMKPGGLDSGAALREYRDATTQRFAQQEKAFEQFYLDTIWLVLECCKELGAKAPEVVRKSKHGPKRIKWTDVDMGEVRVQLMAASNLSKTPAGRVQFAMELAQAGVITVDESRRLMQHPDTESALSLYTAAMECIEADIEEILDGAVLVPDPYSNASMTVWRGQNHLLKAKQNGAPEEILENLRQYVVQAAWIESQAKAPATVGPAIDPMTGAPADPAAMPGAAPPMPSAGAAPGAALTGAGVAPMASL